MAPRGEKVFAPSLEGRLDRRTRAVIQACIDELTALLQGDAGEAGEPERAPEQAVSGEAFPLTDLQQAYFVGEQGVGRQAAPALYIHEYAFPSGAVPDYARLDGALRRIRQARSAMRLRITQDGMQSVDAVPESAGGIGNAALLTLHDLSGLPEEKAGEELARLRESLTADIPPHDAARPFLLRLVPLPDGTARLQIALRLTAFDGVTIQLFFAELARCYADRAHRPEPETLSFRDYVLRQRDRAGAAAREAALRTWEDRLDTLPPAADLPRATAAEQTRAALAADQPATGGPDGQPLAVGADGHREGPGGPLHRTAHRLDPDSWKRFRRHAADAGLSADAALAGLYAETLLRWSGGRPGTVTVLASERAAGPAGADRVWGSGATTVLVGFEPGDGTFVERCRAFQDRLYTALEAGEVSGVEVGRMLNQRRGTTGNPVPYVFSSGLGLVDGVDDGFRLKLPGASLVHSAISTPEVLLDHQVYEQSGHLVCNFDHDPAAFPPGLVDDLAAHHRERLLRLATDPAEWTRTGPDPLPESQVRDRRRANDTAVDGLDGELHEAALGHLRRTPDATAVIDAERSLSHAETDRLSGALAVRLRAAGIGADPARPDLVAVRVPKSWQQTVAVLGVLRAGGAYLPTAPGWPASRVTQVLRQSGAAAVVAPAGTGADGLPELDGLPDLPVVAVPGLADADGSEDAYGSRGAGSEDAYGLRGADAADAPGTDVPVPDGLGGDLRRTAYVIYTSGSTGTPKGVVISHGAATNTLRDLEGRFALGPDDRVLAVSSLAFDLSVFDIFGTLGAGGTVVVPPDSEVPDPETWGELCRRHGVTVWNSVPALLQVTLEYLGDRAAETFRSLRLIMLSGDWIPLSLLDRIARVCPDARVVAMGGATEASIWSNHFWAEGQPEGWSSVPYGYPLANQTMHVLDERLADAPVWVPGDLYIGGAGVADGYHRAPALTEASFLTHPVTGERLYRTGDRARYRPGGILEFLGREDAQVKVGGHRIELGEIEARLAARPEVEHAVALVAGSREEPYLAAFVTPAATGTAPDPDALRARLAAELPPYMVPPVLRVVDAVPLSSNGKVDRKALLARLTGPAAPAAPGASRAPGAGDTPGGSGAGVAPRTPEEVTLLGLWQQLLGPQVRGVTDDFFALGGNSLLAVRLFHRIKAAFGRTLPLAALMRGRTVAEQAAQLGRADDERGSASPLVRIRDGVPGITGGAQHLVLVHPVGGDVLCYDRLVRELAAHPAAARATVYGLRATGLLAGERPARDMTALVAAYADALLEAVPAGELHLAGWSMGGTVSVDLAARLEERGRSVASVTALDSFTGDPGVPAPTFRQRLTGFFADLAQGADVTRHVPDGLPGTAPGDPADLAAALRAVQDALLGAGLLAGPLHDDDLVRLFTVYAAHSALLEAHEPAPAHPRLRLLRARGTARRAFPGLVPLEERLTGAAPPEWLDGDHYSVMAPEAARGLAALLAGRLPGRPVDESYLDSTLWC
ncbi:non-ribosomal peptide synthetase [Streptomyces thermolilacinus]|uniref:non-ribosomal peptide synthetase n=1 Tax=Streptomyces thermolilacinus TaxID=285540 RepID=UPI001112DAF7|nr:non-ribosomal peptide synthetase [Streptomyces thermolilacinus]